MLEFIFELENKVPLYQNCIFQDIHLNISLQFLLLELNKCISIIHAYY